MHKSLNDYCCENGPTFFLKKPGYSKSQTKFNFKAMPANWTTWGQKGRHVYLFPDIWYPKLILHYLYNVKSILAFFVRCCSIWIMATVSGWENPDILEQRKKKKPFPVFLYHLVVIQIFEDMVAVMDLSKFFTSW